jgi:hypothetical protein
MSQQYNKHQKRKRRVRYLKRLKGRRKKVKASAPVSAAPASSRLG